TTLASLGDSIVLTPGVRDRDGRPVAGARLRWSASPAGIVEPDSEGVYRAVGNGRVAIVAALDPGETGVRPAGYWVGPIADTVVVEVRQQAAGLALLPVDTAFRALGAQRQLRVQVTDARGHPLQDDPPPLTWRSADSTVVAVDSAGVARSLAQGTARITVHAEGLDGAATFTVDPRLPHTSCMVYAQRGETREACVTLEFVLRARGIAR
ncbi:MAG TPA: hypothetical protein VFS08_06045, partial [Gemmatimonadaceae bacterium]|nr:hypothetical protein [Gemmatimonadaceae bacterium]